jgi:predicted O-methyltransferase YrrM
MKKEKPKQSSAEKILRQIEKLAQLESLPIIGPDRGKILADEVRRAKPLHVLEVGTLVGYSTILVVKELDKDAEVVTVEINSNAAKAVEENIEKADIPPKVTIIVGDAIEVIPTLNGPFDFAFIDAKKNDYLRYLKLAESKFHSGTVVAADNAGFRAEQMSDYLDYVRNSGNYGSRYLQVEDDGLEISVRI